MHTTTPREEATDAIEEVRGYLRDLDKIVRTGRLNWRQEQNLTRTLVKCSELLAPRATNLAGAIKEEPPLDE
jgi:hypothetical protein